MDEYLKGLVNKSIFILREVKSRFKNPAILYSTGKDSTVTLYLLKKAFNGKVPFPILHLDTSFKFKEIYKFRDRLVKEWNLNLIISKNEEALKQGMSPKKFSSFECCNALKTIALKNAIKNHHFDSVIVSIRNDEHGIRGKERYFSPRDKEFRWKTSRVKQKGDSGLESLQDAEFSGWNLYSTDFGEDTDHVRIHPLLHWNEIDVWQYIKQEKLPINPLYFAVNGKRYRSIGCKCCTTPVKSNAKNVDGIIEELKKTKISERAGRTQDKEEIIEQLRALGYM